MTIHDSHLLWSQSIGPSGSYPRYVSRDLGTRMYNKSHGDVGYVYTARRLENNLGHGIEKLTIGAKANIDLLRAGRLAMR